jgi:hypothetical protein
MNMNRQTFLIFLRLILAIIVLAFTWDVHQGQAQTQQPSQQPLPQASLAVPEKQEQAETIIQRRVNRMTNEQRKAAADRAAAEAAQKEGGKK